MLRVNERILRWSESDIGVMTDIIGEEEAVKGRCPLVASILKIAQHRGRKLDTSAQRVLDGQDRKVREMRALTTASRLGTAHAPLDISPLGDRAWVHQRDDLQFIRESNVPAILLAHDVGVGKTLSALMATTFLWQTKRNLVITRNFAKDQWKEAIQRWIPKDQRGKIVIVRGTIPDQRRRIERDAQWTIAHWESLVNSPKVYRSQDWGTIIADEAHLIGNKDTYRSTLIAKLPSQRRMALTAHPYSNHPGELWPILRFLYPHLYRSYWRFFYQHVSAQAMAFGGFHINGPKRPKLLKWELAPFTLKRTKKEVWPHLPALTKKRVTIELPSGYAKEYERLKKQFFVELEGYGDDNVVIPVINDLARLTRVRQYLIDPGLIKGGKPSLKYPVVHELLMDAGCPGVVFTNFRQAALRCGEYLRKKKLRVGYIYGGMKTADVTRVRKDFTRGRLDSLNVVAQAGDTALNIGGFGLVIHLDLPWNPRGYEQATGRVDRPDDVTGKMVPTTANRIIVKDSYEARLEQKLIKKDRDFGKVFTVGQLKALFTD